MKRLLLGSILMGGLLTGCGAEPSAVEVRGSAAPSAGGGATQRAGECLDAESAATENNQPVKLRLCVSNTTPKKGQEVEVTVTASDPDARLFPLTDCMPNGIHFGQGPRCAGGPACGARQGPDPVEPGELSQSFTRTYDEPGLYPVEVQVQSGDQCGHPYSSATGATVDIFVRDT